MRWVERWQVWCLYRSHPEEVHRGGGSNHTYQILPSNSCGKNSPRDVAEKGKDQKNH